jgi:hypothetical protein
MKHPPLPTFNYGWDILHSCARSCFSAYDRTSRLFRSANRAPGLFRAERGQGLPPFARASPI